MIKGNTIYFGTGDIMVTGTPYRISFKQITPAYEPGYRFGANDSYNIIGKPIFFDIIEFEDADKLVALLDKVPGNGYAFKYKDYYFDFTRYDSRSIKVIKDAIDSATTLLQMAIAA